MICIRSALDRKEGILLNKVNESCASKSKQSGQTNLEYSWRGHIKSHTDSQHRIIQVNIRNAQWRKVNQMEATYIKSHTDSQHTSKHQKRTVEKTQPNRGDILSHIQTANIESYK